MWVRGGGGGRGWGPLTPPHNATKQTTSPRLVFTERGKTFRDIVWRNQLLSTNSSTQNILHILPPLLYSPLPRFKCRQWSIYINFAGFSSCLLHLTQNNNTITSHWASTKQSHINRYIYTHNNTNKYTSHLQYYTTSTVTPVTLADTDQHHRNLHCYTR